MVKILGSRFHYYRNEAHYEFFVVFKGKVVLFPSVMSLIQNLFPEFNELLEQEEKSVDAQKKSPFTALIVNADSLNDKLILGIRETVSGAMRHYDATIAAAAVRLNDRLKDFGKIEKKSYEEEAGAISILINDLQIPPLATDIVTVGIDGWITQLSAAVENFKSLLTQRNESLAPSLPKENLRTIRSKIEKVYRKMTAKVNAAAELDDTGAYDSFILQLNAEIQYFNDHTHQNFKKDLAAKDYTIIKDPGVQTYTGKAITPIPVVIYREPAKQDVSLTFGVDFSLTYKNNIKPGMAEIIVHGKGAYKGKISSTFTIDGEEVKS
jgi:hypothetical protein